MLEVVEPQQHLDFDDRGRRWAHRMRERLQERLLDVPLLWPGTREQAETIVHAFTTDALDESARQLLVEAVQAGARSEWHKG